MPGSMAAHQMVEPSGSASRTTSMPSGVAITQHTCTFLGRPVFISASMLAAIEPPVASIGSVITSVLFFTLGDAMYSVCTPTSVCSRLVYIR